MIVTWMLAALLFTLCVGVAALATERLLRAHGRAARGVWLVAMAIAVIWPTLVLLMPHVVSTPLEVLQSAGHLAPNTAVLAPDATKPPIAALLDWLTANSSAINTTVFALWAAWSAALLMRMFVAVRHVRAMTRGALSLDVDGAPLLVADSIGPASVGWRRPQVIVPSWVLSLDASLRSLVLRHEREHCIAHDPRLVWCSAVASALVPWNAGVWWMARRLRLALELDCDERTLRHGGDRVLYAKLLLFMTQQHVAVRAELRTDLRLATSLAASRSHLGRRIQAMQHGAGNTSRMARIALATLAVAAVAAACGTEIPADVVVPGDGAGAEQTAQAQSASSAGSTTREIDIVDPESSLDATTAAAPRALSYDLSYPPMMRAARVEGTVVVAFVVDTNGRVDMSSVKVVSSDHELFTTAVKRALVSATFDAARVNGKPVRQMLEQPFVFALGMDSAASKLDRFTEPGAIGVVVPEREKIPGVEQTPRNHEAPSPVRLTSPLNIAYPPLLRDAEVEGDVSAQFVVNTDGSVDIATFKVIQSDHQLFADAVRTALLSARYSAAQAGETLVRQLTQQRFSFSLAR